MNGLRKRIDGQVCPSLCLIAAVVTILLYSSTALAQPVKVLFVKNGWYQQEADIYNHLTDLGSYDITTKKDYQIYGSTDLSIYDLIIITEFAPNISYSGLNNIKNSGKPVLIVEYWDFWYSYKLGLVEDDWAGYYGTDTVEVITPEHPIARRFGDEIEVYSTSYTVYGIPYSDIKDGVTPLIYSSSSFNEVAVLSDNDRKIAATGIYDTTRFTVRGWMLFDYLLNGLYQIAPERENPLSVWDDLIASELLVFLGQVEENPSGWTEDEVLREVWKKMLKWDLFPLNEQINLWVQEIFPELYIIPELIPIPCSHYERVDFTGYENDNHLWFLGQYGEFWGESETGCWVSNYIKGVDLGISTEFFGKLVFYMGDTIEADENYPGNCHIGTGRCNDSIVESIDEDPSDGVNVGPFLEQWSGDILYNPLSIFGFHNHRASFIWYPDIIDPKTGELMDFGQFISNWWHFTVPTGAMTMVTDRYYLEPQPTIVTWYSKGVSKSAEGYPNIYAPYSYAACSTDKVQFWNCYSIYSPFVHFSHDKFINVSPVWLNASDIDMICDNDPLNHMCLLDGTKGGILLFGNGPRYRRSSLYLAFIASDDFGNLNSNDRPIVNYYTGNSGSPWSSDEADAMPIIEAIPGQRKTQFGEISVKLIREGIPEGDEPYFVLLYNYEPIIIQPHYIQHRIAELSSPWDWTQPNEPSNENEKVKGYGPFIMEKFTEYDAESETLRLWHTISSWTGDGIEGEGIEDYTDYGVYTTWTEISPWPPVILE